MKLKTAWALALARVYQRSNLAKIEQAGGAFNTVDVTYVKKDGEIIHRELTPYETKPHRTTGQLMVYATDNKDGPAQIKSFIANRIRKVDETTNEFDPVWSVQYETSEDNLDESSNDSTEE